MSTEKTKRPVGRPANPEGRAQTVTISMTAEQVKALRALGGSRWVQEQIRKATEQNKQA